MYAQEIRNQLLAEGHVIRNMPDLIAAASPKWQKLDEEMKEYYKEKAKYEWERQRAGEAPPMFRSKAKPRRDCNGDLLANRVDYAKMNDDRRRREREETIATWPQGKDVIHRKFYLVAFVCLLEEPEHQALEVAANEFTLEGGITRKFHRFIDPGPIPLGCRYEAQRRSEATHMIPVEGLANEGDTHRRIYDELLYFLSAGTGVIPPIFVKIKETTKVEGCMHWLAKNAGVPNKLKRIYELEGLILDLEYHIAGLPPNFTRSKVQATDLMLSTVFDYDTGTRCQYHENEDATDCASKMVNTACFCMGDYFCQRFSIPITDNHLPKRNEDCYTILPTPGNRVRGPPPSHASGMQSRNGGGTGRNSEDVAEQVARKLVIEKERQQQEEQREQAEILSQEEQQRKWASLRHGHTQPQEPQAPPVITGPPTAAVQSHLNDDDYPSLGASTKKSHLNDEEYPTLGAAATSPKKPETQKVYVGRGRGRGLAGIVELRKPGQPAPKVPPGFSAMGRGSFPGVGRGTYLQDVSSEEFPPPQRAWAGSAAAPPARDAPAPPSAWYM